ncbi:Methyltransferase-like 26 B [Larimichthys crocea]|uniref:Methyltransferase-like 26 B n=1 Tax=Larimichthys crocea TaxID=215358 RepID=A0A6G0HVS0_LARCR|nr:Methyltransferase-like 26 B [Larimichthys crocea]
MLLSPQAEKNWEGLCSVLEDVLEDQSHRKLFGVELGSGTGQHVIRFAQKMPFVTWQPSDINEESLNSIKAYIAATHAKNVQEPAHLDASEPWEQWAGLHRSSCDVIVAINLLQYSSFKTAQLYAINGTITPSCNEHLDAGLRKMNPEWGLPDMDVLRQLAFGNGMRLERIIEMEEYYKCLIFRKL